MRAYAQIVEYRRNDLCKYIEEVVMNETEAATLQAICILQHHSGNPWQMELRVFQARAEAGEDITTEVFELLSPNENVRRWMRDQIGSVGEIGTRGISSYQKLSGARGRINASYSWLCPRIDCTESLPVIQEGEDPPTCEAHKIAMVRGKN
jgi:hypothetical protein